MNLKPFLRSAALTLAALAASATIASAHDKVIVEFPFNVTVGNKVLEPGKYTIKQLENSNSKVLLIHNGEGEFQAMMLPIPAYSLRTPEDTKVVLHRVGNDEYHFDKVWIEGKNYGYEIPLSDKAKARQAEWMLAMATAPPVLSADLPTEIQEFTEVAQADLPTAPLDLPVATVGAPAADPVVERESAALEAPLPVSDATTATAAEETEMPETSANWVPMLLLGAAIPTTGLWALRRR